MPALRFGWPVLQEGHGNESQDVCCPLAGGQGSGEPLPETGGEKARCKDRGTVGRSGKPGH